MSAKFVTKPVVLPWSVSDKFTVRSPHRRLRGSRFWTGGHEAQDLHTSRDPEEDGDDGSEPTRYSGAKLER